LAHTWLSGFSLGCWIDTDNLRQHEVISVDNELNEIKRKASQECTCSDEPLRPGDPPFCVACDAAYVLDKIAEDLRDELRHFKSRRREEKHGGFSE
jgi:hypothetical protein